MVLDIFYYAAFDLLSLSQQIASEGEYMRTSFQRTNLCCHQVPT